MSSCRWKGITSFGQLFGFDHGKQKCTHVTFKISSILLYLKKVGLNNILFIQISPTQHVHITFIEDLNESILLIEFISSCKKFTPLILYIVTAFEES